MSKTINAGRVTFVPKDNFSNNIRYKKFDIVTYNGSSYFAKKDTIGHTPTEEEFWQLVAEKGQNGEPGAVKMQVVDTLPETGETDTIYLVKKDNPGEQNLYDEYVYTDTGWEHIGDTSVDLTDYYTKEESDKNLNDTISENMPLFINAPKYADFVGEKTTEIFRKWYNNYKNGKYIPIMLYTFSRIDWKYVYCFLTGVHDDSRGRLYLYFTNMKVNSSNEIIPSTISYAPTYIEYSGTPDKSFVSINANNDNGSLPFKQITNITNSTISNYTLTKTNTTAYTPTKEYHPATKLYVDSNVKTYTAGDNIKISEDNVISATINNTENIPIYKLKLSVYSTLEWETLNFIEGDDATRLKEILTDVKNKQLSLFYIDVSDYNDQYHTLLTPRNTIVFGSSPTSSLDFKGLCLQNRQIGVDQSTPLSGIQISINGINWGGDSVTFNSAMFLLTPNHFIPIDNTTVYAPTADYHPATKKYVDDTMASVEEPYLLSLELQGVLNEYITNSEKLTGVSDLVNKIYNKQEKNPVIILKNTTYYYTSANAILYGASNFSIQTQNYTLQGYTYNFEYASGLTLTPKILTITGSWDNNVFTCTKIQYSTGTGFGSTYVLTKTNTTSYTPTSDYHPATKKYVDDQVGNINTILATLTTVSEVSK